MYFYSIQNIIETDVNNFIKNNEFMSLHNFKDLVKSYYNSESLKSFCVKVYDNNKYLFCTY